MDSICNREQRNATLRSARVRGNVRALSLLLLACFAAALTGCGGGGSNSSTAPASGALSGNWQFALAVPADNSFEGDPSGASSESVLQGGLLVQKNGTVTGQAVFSIWVKTQFGSLVECNSGAATINGTVSGQSVSLTATIGAVVQNPTTGAYEPGTQTFTLSGGQLSSDNSSIQGGTYTSTAGYYLPQGSSTYASCGTAQTTTNPTWSAASVPSITGSFQGFFHSTSQANSLLAGQVFSVTGSLLQGPNIGASSATVTGTLTFTGYPCLTKAAVNGQISGSAVVLQIFNASSGTDVGQLGGLGTGNGTTYPVVFNSTSNGYVLQNSIGIAYALNTSGCSGSGLSSGQSGDAGNVCLSVVNPNSEPGGPTPCTEPITVSPASLTFPAQLLASGTRTRQDITITDVQPVGSAPLSLSLSLTPTDSTLIYPAGGDFNGFPNFTEQDTCGGTISPQQSCTISISFLPQESCPWLPYGSVPAGSAPVKCPGLFNNLVAPKSLLSALLQISVPGMPDRDNSVSIPIKGSGLSAIVPSTAELDFSAEDLGEASSAQNLTFTNQSTNPVQILSAVSGFGQTCNSDMRLQYTLPRPPVNGVIPGLVVVATNGGTNNITADQGPPTVLYFCDFDQATSLSSFQIATDSCSGQTLGASGSANDSCSVQIVFAPQPDSYSKFPDSNTKGGLDYFLQLNTLQCDLNDSPPQPPPSPSNPCEIDSGRFPVELTANPPGSLRMSPGAGVEFGTWLKGAVSAPLTITLTNGQQDNATVTFTGKALTGTDYLEADDCQATLSPGGTCTLTFTFMPTVTGFDSGSLTIGYSTSSSSGNQYNLTQYIYLRGIGGVAP